MKFNILEFQKLHYRFIHFCLYIQRNQLSNHFQLYTASHSIQLPALDDG